MGGCHRSPVYFHDAQNKPKINEDPKDALIREYQDEMKRLEEQLKEIEAHGGSAAVLKPKVRGCVRMGWSISCPGGGWTEFVQTDVTFACSDHRGGGDQEAPGHGGREGGDTQGDRSAAAVRGCESAVTR